MGWTGKAEFAELSRELARCTDRDFERQLLPFVRLRWPNARQSPPRKTLDSSGIDIASGGEPRFDLVIQCKGFEEDELFEDQARQCLASIRKFAQSRYSAERYILVHNRPTDSKEYRAKVWPELQKLERDKKVAKADLWNHRDVVAEAFEAMRERVVNACRKQSLALMNEQGYVEQVLGGDPLDKVPLTVGELRIDQYRMRSAYPVRFAVEDPVGLLFSNDSRRLPVLIAAAGHGKTTNALRAVRTRRESCLFIPGARIAGDVGNAQTLFELALDREDILREAVDHDAAVWSRIIGPVLKTITQADDGEIAFVFDALDESSSLQKSWGLQRFFNQLGRVKVPVIVTMRSEFWKGRQQDFQVPAGGSQEAESVGQTLRVIELQPWGNAQIAEAARRYARRIDGEGAKRVSDFMRLVESDGYDRFYGDIPRTPLFLKFILDCLRDDDLTHMSRRELVARWISMKISRDVHAPVRLGGERMPIAPGVVAADDTIAVAWEAMTVAAAEMLNVADGHITLEPSCEFRSIRAAVGPPTPTDATALSLNSLLMPTGPRAVDGTQRLRFLHALFQDYFSALHIAANPREFEGVVLTESIAGWLREIGMDRAI